MKTKAEFLSSPKRAKLSRAQQEARWQQYVASQRGVRGAVKLTSVNKSPAFVDPLTRAIIGTSECGIHYLQALTDPFAMKEAACIPDLHAIPSKKVLVKHRSTFSTGTNGAGYIVYNSQAKSNNDTIVMATDASNPLTPSTLLPNWAGGIMANVIKHASVKLPYPNTEFQGDTADPGIMGRVVGTAIRVRYIGPELARGGQFVAFRHPDGYNVTGLSIDDWKSYMQCKTFPVDREWVYVMYAPVRPGDYQYSPNSATNATTASTSYQFNLGIAAINTTTSSGTPGPAPFEFEWVQIIEYLGKIDNISKTHVDVEAMSQIRNVTEQKSATRHPHKNTAKALVEIGENMKTNMSPASLHAITSHPVAQIAYRGNDKKSDPGLLDRLIQGARSFGDKVLGPKLETYAENGLARAFDWVENKAIGLAEEAFFA
jgi:hypothetical protein